MTPPRVRAPAEDGALLAVPPLAEARRLAHANHDRLARSGLTLLGRPWADASALARAEILGAAHAYLHAAGQPVEPTAADLVVLAGHQPELFHPGVWIKHFALSRLSSEGLRAINLVVDNDTVKTTSLAYPSEDGGLAHRATLAFDRPPAGEPLEEAAVRDESLFASFADRFHPSWPFEPLLPTFWRDVLRHARRTPLLGERFAAARRDLERRWGCHNLEVPVSRVCTTEAYALFAADVLLDLPRFHAAYNAAVAGYRRRYGLRSTSHPVPDLAAEGDWLESPFWAWRAGAARRGRLLARRSGGRVALRVGEEAWPDLPGSPDEAVTAYRRLEAEGYKVRSRALVNTLFARLFAGDLFIHGIGGGKYDEVTDELIRRYYEIQPPEYLILSGTLLLPLPSSGVTAREVRRLADLARDLAWNPQRHVPADDRTAHKAALVGRKPAEAADRKPWFHQLRAATEALRPAVAERLDLVRRRLTDARQAVRADEVRRRRDYAFCLYPEAILRAFCTG